MGVAPRSTRGHSGAPDDGQRDAAGGLGGPTGVDDEVRIACRDAAELEEIVDRLRQEHGVVAIRSRMVLHDLAVEPGGLTGA